MWIKDNVKKYTVSSRRKNPFKSEVIQDGSRKNVIHMKEVKEAETETEASLADETPKAQTSIRKGQHTLKDQL